MFFRELTPEKMLSSLFGNYKVPGIHGFSIKKIDP